MRCKCCDSSDVVVVDKNDLDHLYTVRRRRECKDCGHKWTVFEVEGDAHAIGRAKSVAKFHDSLYLEHESVEDLVDEIEASIEVQAEKRHMPSDALLH